MAVKDMDADNSQILKGIVQDGKARVGVEVQAHGRRCCARSFMQRNFTVCFIGLAPQAPSFGNGRTQNEQDHESLFI